MRQFNIHFGKAIMGKLLDTRPNSLQPRWKLNKRIYLVSGWPVFPFREEKKIETKRFPYRKILKKCPIFNDQCSILRQDTKVNPETLTISSSELFIFKVALHVIKQQTSTIARAIYKKWTKKINTGARTTTKKTWQYML